jgi:hypothetical protein
MEAGKFTGKRQEVTRKRWAMKYGAGHVDTSETRDIMAVVGHKLNGLCFKEE